MSQADTAVDSENSADNLTSENRNTVMATARNTTDTTAPSPRYKDSPEDENPSNKPNFEIAADINWGSPEMIPQIQQLVKQTPTGHPDLLKYHRLLGQGLKERHRISGNLGDLDASVQAFQGALDLTPEGHPDRAQSLKELGVLLLNRFTRLGQLKDLEASLHKFQEAVDLTPPSNPYRAACLQNLALSLQERYSRLGDLKDLEASIQNQQAALHLTVQGDPKRAGHLYTLAMLFRNRYQRLGNFEDIEAALHQTREAVDLTPKGHPDRAGGLQNLAVSFRIRYYRLGDFQDLQAALKNDQEAVELTPEADPNRAGHLRSLSLSLLEQYYRLGSLSDLEAALQNNQEAVDLTPKDHPERASHLHNLAMTFRERYHRLGAFKDLDVALQKHQEVVTLTPEGHPKRAEYLQSLSATLLDRSHRLGDLNDLQDSRQTGQEAVNLTPERDPMRASRLNILGSVFLVQYHTLGDLKDLETSLEKFKEALDILPEGHPGRSQYLKCLAATFSNRYKRLGELKDLEASLQTFQEAMDLTPKGHPERPESLLAVSFTDRYRRLGDLKDLQTSLKMRQEVVDITPEGHPDQAEHLEGLAVSFVDRYQRLGDLKDLESSLQLWREVVNLNPEGHPNRARGLYGLATRLTDRYRRLGDLQDLESSITINQEAVDLTPEGHPNRAMHLKGYAVSLGDRYLRVGDVKDLNAALQKFQEAVALTPKGHPDQVQNLESVLHISIFQKQENLEAVHLLCNAAFKTPSFRPQFAWEQALEWASFSKEFRPPDCLSYVAAFSLLPDILWIGHSIPARHDTVHRLNITWATSNAIQTCINLSYLTSAVEIMEQGIATIFQQMLQLKTDVDGLNPNQAKRFRDLSSQIYSGSSQNLMEIVNDRNELLREIRKEPGLENFLLPKPYDALRHASQGGPVVILNSHEDQCDAIIILNPTSEPVHVPLQGVTLGLLALQQIMLKNLLGHCNVRNRGDSSASRLFGQQEQFSSEPTEKRFANMLHWLWINIVAPVYQVLELVSHGIHNGRLWWLPTGAFTGLPLHACPPTDHFIHSYTETLGSLLDAYGKKILTTAPKCLIVGVTHTGAGSRNFLKGVEQEVEKIVSIIGKPHVQCLEGGHATVDAVTLQLQDSSWVHLACHGSQNLGDPTKSHLRLYGGILELDTILRMPLSNAQFVFLAACQTAMGDGQLVNESFHLGGGFIAAGFQGAIGTMWAMNDQDGPTVAEIVYSHLFRKGQKPDVSDAAEALQLAVKELKARKFSHERWIPFIHMGI
ncbi:CHAT domain-containing protein, partial [Mycena latifolia]